MDTDTLRLVLFILGVAFIAAIYFWDKRHHVDRKLHRRQEARKARRHDSTVFDRVEHRQMPDSHQKSKIQQSSPVADPAAHNDREVSDESVVNETPVLTPSASGAETVVPSFSSREDDREPDDTDALSFSASDAFSEFEAGADLPSKILQVNLVARDHEISGQMILDLAAELDLKHGEFSIFHRLDPRTGKSVFSMANVVEPGSFDLQNMQNLRTPGLTLFSQLPAPLDSLLVYDEMIKAAKRISFILGTEMQDATRSVMTQQSIDHTREEIIDYRQRLQLAMQKL